MCLQESWQAMDQRECICVSGVVPIQCITVNNDYTRVHFLKHCLQLEESKIRINPSDHGPSKRRLTEAVQWEYPLNAKAKDRLQSYKCTREYCFWNWTRTFNWKLYFLGFKLFQTKQCQESCFADYVYFYLFPCLICAIGSPSNLKLFNCM